MRSKNRRRQHGRVIAGLLVLAAAVGWGGIASAQAGTKPDAYQFALIMPMTGGNAGYGMDQVRSALMGVADINANGGVDGVPLKVITEDSQANPQLGVSAFKKAVSVNKVPIVVTAWSAVVSAIAPFAAQDHVLTFSIGANNPKIKDLKPWVRTTFPLSDVGITALAKYTYTKLDKKTAAIVYVNNDTGVFAARLYKQIFEAAGGKVVLMEGVPQDTTNFTSVIAKIMSVHPDVVHMQLLNTGVEQFPGEYRASGGTALLTSYEAAQDPVLIKRSPQAANGIIFFSTAPDPSLSKPVADFISRWTAKFGRAPNGPSYCEYLYDAPYVIKAVIEYMNAHDMAYTGDNARKAFEALGSITLPLTGKMVMQSDGGVVKPVFINEIENGKFVRIDTVSPGT
jgi:branched-chain amino acid transport system substrate-binding protein